MKDMQRLTDPHGRDLTYLRLSLTDRCNFRCYYCMPEEGAQFAARAELLSFPELLRLSALFCRLGISKIRLTGGEPFVRRGILPFLEGLAALDGLADISVTSNGTLLRDHLDALERLGIRNINISLDSLDRRRFHEMTRRDRFDEVYATVLELIERDFEVKLNCVVSAARNTVDIVPFIELTRSLPVAVRFLEEMPFNGRDTFEHSWSHLDIQKHIEAHFPERLALLSPESSTSLNYRIPGHAGTFGIIPSYSRTFCGACNRLRLSATGDLRTCLYGPPAVNLRDLLRSGAPDEDLSAAITGAVARRESDGFAAEAANASIHESMSLLGG
jgi:molybdenum cofactor biosynthesis protein A